MIELKAAKENERCDVGSTKISNSDFFNLTNDSPHWLLRPIAVRLPRSIVGDPGAASRDDRMFDLIVNFHYEHSIQWRIYGRG